MAFLQEQILSSSLYIGAYFLINEIRVCSIFSGAKKFCLAHELRQLTLKVMSDVTRHNEDLQMTFGVGRCTMLIVNILFKTSILQRLGTKNNQSSVSDAD